MPRPDAEVVVDLADFADFDDYASDPKMSDGPSALRSSEILGWAA
jgi:hypothetical protein